MASSEFNHIFNAGLFGDSDQGDQALRGLGGFSLALVVFRLVTGLTSLRGDHHHLQELWQRQLLGRDECSGLSQHYFRLVLNTSREVF